MAEKINLVHCWWCHNMVNLVIFLREVRQYETEPNGRSRRNDPKRF